MIAGIEKATVVTATEAKNNFGALLRRVVEGDERIVVERQGKPQAVVISVGAFARFLTLLEDERRRTAFEGLRALRERLSERTNDLGDEQIEQIADRLTRDAVDGLVEKGHVRFVP